MPQNAILFSGDAEDNIRFGRDDATPEEVEHAAAVAQVESLSGANLSGGQRQRLSIARALIRDAEIYVFDDSFSALDFKTDAALRAALKNEIGDKTRIIVAQRIGTIMDADKIVVLNEGEIVGTGTHKELLSTCEVYGEIAKSQLSEEELAGER